MNYKSIHGFTYVEKIGAGVLSQFPDTLLLDKQASSESILFRLLLGTVDLKLNSQEKVISQNYCFNKIREEFEEDKSKNSISDWMESSFGLSDLDQYFKLNRKNKALFDELLTEFSFFFIYRESENNVTAFLHLYRALEYMSYSFPMTYSSKTSNFYTSFDTFKGFFANKDAGQLKFFQEFIQALFDKSTLTCRTKIDTYIGDEMLDKKKKKIIQKLCSEFSSYDDGYVLSIQYKNLLDLMINLRNRYFHFQADRNDNISNIDFDSEAFFSSLNNKFANWLSMIYLEILIQGVYKLNLLTLK